MILADFHTHTIYSDGQLTLTELVDLYGKRGIGAIAVTDHLCENLGIIGKASRYLGCSLTKENFSTYIDHVEEEASRAWLLYKMLVIPGVELTRNTISNQRSAHILGIGIRKWIDPNQDAVELCRAIREQGGISVAAHPVFTRKIEKQTYHLWDRREELAKEFDAWEVASGPHIFNEVLHSGLPMLASSDLHTAKQLSSWKTVFQCEKTEAAMLNAVREQQVSFAFYRDPAADLIGIQACPFPL